MKKTTLKFLSTFYILLVSVVLLVVTTYAWSTISTSPESGAQMGIAPGSSWIVDGKEGYAAQIGTNWYRTISEALATVEEGQTELAIDLINDVEENITIPSGLTVTLNLAGYKITNTSSDTLTVEEGATLIINDTSLKKTGVVDNVTHQKAALFNNGTVIINNGTFTRSAEASTSVNNPNGNSYYNIINHGTMTIQDATVVSSGAFSSLVANGYYNYSDSGNPRIGFVEGVNSANPMLTINGGTFTGGINTIKNDDGAILTINGGTFTNSKQNVVLNAHKAYLNGGVFSAQEEATCAVRNYSLSSEHNICQVSITGGVYNGAIVYGTETVISGGKFTQDISDHLADGYQQVPVQYEVVPSGD